MPSKSTTRKAKRDLARGKSPSTAAGEFVHEEMEHIRQRKHGARSTRQAIAIGLSEARRAGVPLKAPRGGQTSAGSRKAAARDYATGQGQRKPRAPSARRGRATERALKREGSQAASPSALSAQGRRAASRRTAAQRSRAAKQGAATKGARARSQAAKRAAATRRRG
ncbi:MAG TPA: DNA-binding protein [Polyangia bacterium]|nr:DNA-binding protein [Polyangia bacterium]